MFSSLGSFHIAKTQFLFYQYIPFLTLYITGQDVLFYTLNTADQALFILQMSNFGIVSVREYESHFRTWAHPFSEHGSLEKICKGNWREKWNQNISFTPKGHTLKVDNRKHFL